MGPLRVALLGDFRATAGDDLLVAGGAKQRAVLAMLALGAGQVVPESRLIDGIWGDQTPNAVRGSLQVYVAHWRRVLAQAGCEERIERHGSGYLLTMEPIGLDVRRVEVLAAHGRAALAEERYGLAAQRLTEALGFWRGDTLHNFVEMPFHLWESMAIETMRTEVLADRIDALLGNGAGGELIPELEALVQRHPYEERFRGQLMHALYRSGRQVDAVRACAAAREVLGEIGLDVGPALRRMEQRVLQQDPDLDVPASPFPPQAPPEALSTLIGRDGEVEELLQETVHGASRLLTLTGPGGVGKSRLALELAQRVAADGWMPVAFTALGDSGDRAMVSSRVNEAFGVPDSWRERSTVDIARMLGRSPILVVIDGAEHLLDDVQSVVSDLLQHGRQIRVMVTSRIELGLVGESVYEVKPLGLYAGDGDADDADEGSGDRRNRVREIPAVALFVERAERALTASDLGAEGLQRVASICRAVDGLPLAIELAAARVSTLGLAGLQRRLEGSLDVLSAPRRPGARRHQSLREVISWSYALLSQDARDLLAVLSVLPGLFGVEHAEALVGQGESAGVLDAFEELARHSLISRVAADDAPRFRMLDTVRTYARERLTASDQTEVVYRRLVTWVTERIKQTGGRMGVGARQFAPLEGETENARAAMTWLLDHGTGEEAGRFCERLYVWWMSIGKAEELGFWATEASRVPEIGELAEGRLALIRGRVDGRKDRFAPSDQLLSRSMHIAQEHGDHDGVVHAASSLVENLVHQGHLDAARTFVDQILELAQMSEDAEVRCRALHAACWLAGSVGDYEGALALGGHLAAQAAAAGLIEFHAKTLADLAWIARRNGQLGEALIWAQDAEGIAIRAETGGAVVSALTELAYAHLELRNDIPAVEAAIRGLAYKSGDDLSPSSVLRLALALLVAARLTGQGELAALSERLAVVASSMSEAVGVWVGDEHVVGDAFRSLGNSGLPRAVKNQADLVAVARDTVRRVRAAGMVDSSAIGLLGPSGFDWPGESP